MTPRTTFQPVDLPTMAQWDSPTLSRVVPCVQERRPVATAEVELLGRIVEQAVTDAEFIARDAPLCGSTYRSSERRAVAAREIAALRRWLSGDHPMSLTWIVAHIEGASGVAFDAESVRARINKAIRRAETRFLAGSKRGAVIVRRAA